MPIELPCTGCGQTLRVPESAAGKKARCPVCSQINEIPLSQGGEGASFPKLEDGPIAVPLSSPEKNPFDEPDSEHWYLRLPSGDEYGPVDRMELERWVTEGRVTDDCLVRSGPYQKWISAPEVFPQIQSRQAHQQNPSSYGHSSPRPQYSSGGVTSGHQPANNPYSEANPYATTSPSYGGSFLPPGVRPHRGGMVLTFGILAWASVIIFCGFGLIFGPLAWIFGAQDLKAMRRGTMDRSGEGTTTAGMWLGAIYTILCIIGVVLFVGLICLIAIADA
jgi:phage FluMu protein Com